MKEDFIVVMFFATGIEKINNQRDKNLHQQACMNILLLTGKGEILSIRYFTHKTPFIANLGTRVTNYTVF